MWVWVYGWVWVCVCGVCVCVPGEAAQANGSQFVQPGPRQSRKTSSRNELSQYVWFDNLCFVQEVRGSFLSLTD